MLVATRANADGHREVLGLKGANSETSQAWNTFFVDMVARGLSRGTWNFGRRVGDRSIGGGPFMAADDADLDQHIARVVDSLAERYTRHDRQGVEQAVAHARDELEAEARVTKYLPVLVSRRAADQLAGRGSKKLGAVADQRRTSEP